GPGTGSAVRSLQLSFYELSVGPALAGPALPAAAPDNIGPARAPIRRGGPMNRYEGTRDLKNPPNSVLGPRARSAALPWFLGSLVVFFRLVGVALVFWSAANPRPSAREERENVVGASGYYSTEGGHDPIRRLRSTRAELKFRGELTPPSGTPRQ